VAAGLTNPNCCDLSWISRENSFLIPGSKRRGEAAIFVGERRVSIEQPKSVGSPIDSAAMSE
jgi:hypothetical protein